MFTMTHITSLSDHSIFWFVGMDRDTRTDIAKMILASLAAHLAQR